MLFEWKQKDRDVFCRAASHDDDDDDDGGGARCMATARKTAAVEKLAHGELRSVRLLVVPKLKTKKFY